MPFWEGTAHYHGPYWQGVFGGALQGGVAQRLAPIWEGDRGVLPLGCSYGCHMMIRMN